MTKIQQQRQFGWMIVSIFIVILAFLFLKTTKTAKYKNLKPVQETGADMIRPGSMEVIGESVSYYKDIKGFYAQPKTPGEYPGIVMIHEWWGLNDNIRDMAKTLASNGYHVLAVDLFEGKVAGNMQEAQNLAGGVNQVEALANMRAAGKFIESRTSLKKGVLGWCFGGGQALQYSLDQKDLNATVIYYGQLSADQTKLKNITWPVLGIFGDRDSSIPVPSVRAFEAALDKNRIPNEIHIYPGVGHAFANPTGANYAPAETKDAWNKTLRFLSEYLK